MKKIIAGIFVALGSLVIGALVINFTGMVPVAATGKDPAVVEWFLHSSYERAVRKNAAAISLPSNLASSENVLKGAKNFAAMCAGCHTAPGNNGTATSRGLNPPPPLAKELASELGAAERFWVIKNGVRMTGMPAFGPSHDDESDLWALVAFAEKLPTLSAESYQQLVKLGRAAFPESDGHAHSHMGERGQSNTQPASAHSNAGHGSDEAKEVNGEGHSAAEKHATSNHNSSTETHDGTVNHESEALGTVAPERNPPSKPAEEDHSGHSH